jgi:hypothetical protein
MLLSVCQHEPRNTSISKKDVSLLVFKQKFLTKSQSIVHHFIGFKPNLQKKLEKSRNRGPINSITRKEGGGGRGVGGVSFRKRHGMAERNKFQNTIDDDYV